MQDFALIYATQIPLFNQPVFYRFKCNFSIEIDTVSRYDGAFQTDHRFKRYRQLLFRTRRITTRFTNISRCENAVNIAGNIIVFVLTDNKHDNRLYKVLHKFCISFVV